MIRGKKGRGEGRKREGRKGRKGVRRERGREGESQTRITVMFCIAYSKN